MIFNENFFKTCITFTSVDEMKRLCEPLSKLKIKNFGYNRYYKDSGIIKLNNYPEFMKFYFEKELYQHSGFAKYRPENDVVLSSWVNDPELCQASKDFGITPSFAIAETHLEYIDYFHFCMSTDRMDNLLSLFSQLGPLYRFIAYFKDRARTLISSAEKSKIYLGSSVDETSTHSFNSVSQEVASFVQMTHTQKFYLNTVRGVYLTIREYDVVDLLIQGKNHKKIAQQLRISEKTVDNHLANIKEKLNCRTLFDLGFILGEIGRKRLCLHIIPDNLKDRD